MPRDNKRKLGALRYKDYTQEHLENCIAEVKNGLSLRKAAKKYNICKRTIQNKIKMMHSSNVGRPRVFTEAEEGVFIDCILLNSEFGFPIDQFDLRHIVKDYLNRSGREIPQFNNNLPGVDWASSFVKRHPVLTTRFAENIKTARAGITKETLESYVARLKVTIDGIPPENIYNYDETNLTDDPGNRRVIVKRGCKYPENVCNKSKAAISIMVCGNAAGEVIPPFIVYKSKYLWDTWTQGGPSGTPYSNSTSGWFNAETFTEWFKQLMLPILKKKTGATALIGDNLSSHITDEVLQLCKEHSVKFVCLPPNSTHLTQPLDVCYFRPMKDTWRRILRKYKESDRSKTCIIQKQHFPALLKELMDIMGSKNILSNAFSKCGIVPCDVTPLLKRLPCSEAVLVITPEQDTDARQSFIQFFAEERASLAPQTARKRLQMQALAGDDLAAAPSNDETSPAEELKKKPAPRKKRKVELNIDELLSSSYSEAQPEDSSTPTHPVDETSTAENVKMMKPVSQKLKIDLDNLGSSSGGEWEEEMSEDSDLEETKRPLQLPPAERQINEFVAFKYNEEIFAGKIIALGDEGPTISALKLSKKLYKWPSPPDVLEYLWSDVIGHIEPSFFSKTREIYTITELEPYMS